MRSTASERPEILNDGDQFGLVDGFAYVELKAGAQGAGTIVRMH